MKKTNLILDGYSSAKSGGQAKPATLPTQHVHKHIPRERLKLLPSGVVGVGGANQLSREPTTGMLRRNPCCRGGGGECKG